MTFSEKRRRLVWLIKSNLAAFQANDQEGMETGGSKNY